MIAAKTVILAGGLRTRLAEETDVKPEPMIETGASNVPLAHHADLPSGRFAEFVLTGTGPR